jgi:hypothetical protein
MTEPAASPEPTMRSAQEAAEELGLTFSGTPGPGYSEGGDVYEPKASKTPAIEATPGGSVGPQRAVGRKTHSAHHGALSRVLSIDEDAPAV